jgi:cytidylate kinase
VGIVLVTRGSYSGGREIAEKVAQKLNYDCISREIILEASKEFNIPEIKLTQAVEDAPSILDRFTQGKRRYIAYTQAALLKYLVKDNVVYHGLVGHYFVEGISHVFKVLITANIEYRISAVMEHNRISRREAVGSIKKIDDQRRKWGQKLYGIDPWDPTLYDLALHIGNIKAEDAVNTICSICASKQFQTTPESKMAIDDLALTVRVRNFLVNVKPSVGVYIGNRFLYLKTQAPLPQDCDLVNKMGHIIKKFPDLKGIKVVTQMEASETDRRRGRDRRSAKDRRRYLDLAYNGIERRHAPERRIENDRRKVELYLRDL